MLRATLAALAVATFLVGCSSESKPTETPLPQSTSTVAAQTVGPSVSEWASRICELLTARGTASRQVPGAQVDLQNLSREERRLRALSVFPLFETIAEQTANGMRQVQPPENAGGARSVQDAIVDESLTLARESRRVADEAQNSFISSDEIDKSNERLTEALRAAQQAIGRQLSMASAQSKMLSRLPPAQAMACLPGLRRLYRRHSSRG
jgi:hypothetical protein